MHQEATARRVNNGGVDNVTPEQRYKASVSALHHTGLVQGLRTSGGPTSWFCLVRPILHTVQNPLDLILEQYSLDYLFYSVRSYGLCISSLSCFFFQSSGSTD